MHGHGDFFDDERAYSGVELAIGRILPVLIFNRLEGWKSGFPGVKKRVAVKHALTSLTHFKVNYLKD